MKKTLLLLSACAIGMTAQAQTAPEKNVGIVNKTTATWCGPCGQWGWELFEEIITDNNAKAICMGTYGSPSSDMYNQTAGDFYEDFASGAGWPAFCALGANRTAYSESGGIYPSTTRTNVKTAIDSFANAPVKASTGYNYTISGQTLNVSTVSKFWSADNGEFFVNAYVIEDSVMNVQAGQSGTVAHHYVLRGGLTGSWGVSLVNGAVAANQTFNKNFTFNIPNDWNKSKIKVVVMLWKKTGNHYNFVNANNVPSAATGIRAIGEAGNVRMYPNPGKDIVTLSFDVEQLSDVSYVVTDITGKVVAEKKLSKTDYGVHHESIHTAAWSNGTYMVKLLIGNDHYTGKLVVSH